MIRLKLFRKYRKPNYTIGIFSINGKEFSHMLEDTVRDLNHDGDLRDPGERKIPGRTAIPYGTYKIVKRHSPSFKRLMPYIEGIDGFSGVMIHWGTTAADTKGCPIIGRNTSIGCVTQSRKTFDAFWKIIENEDDIEIEIV